LSLSCAGIIYGKKKVAQRQYDDNDIVESLESSIEFCAENQIFEFYEKRQIS